MNAEIVTIGTELLLGEIVDTNSTYIARQLRDIGINVYYITTVGDNRERIAQALRTALGRSDVVITTGGLGPTVDDMTRQAAADATGRDLEFHPALLEEIAERFRQFGARMSDNNRVQAYIPAGALPVRNPYGTAPCFIVEDDMGMIISLPGVPREMKALLAETVVPYLRERSGGRGIIKALVLRTAGIGESHIDDLIGDLEYWSNPTVGLAAHTGQTDIRITARADTEAEADALIADAETIVRERLGGYIYGTDADPLEAALGERLAARGFRLAVSYTGPEPEGLLVRYRTAYPELIACHFSDPNALVAAWPGNSAISDTAGLPYGHLASREAGRVRAQTGADVVVAIVTDDAGTGIVAQTPTGQRVRQYGFGGSSADAQVWAGTWGMSMAWRLLREMDEDGDE